MSLAQLAEETELDIQALWECEEGTRRVTASELWNLCGAFDVSPAVFFEERD